MRNSNEANHSAEQTPSECKHIRISERDIAHCRCENRIIHYFGGKPIMEDCPYYKKCVQGVTACPDYEPKEKKNNER